MQPCNAYPEYIYVVACMASPHYMCDDTPYIHPESPFFITPDLGLAQKELKAFNIDHLTVIETYNVKSILCLMYKSPSVYIWTDSDPSILPNSEPKAERYPHLWFHAWREIVQYYSESMAILSLSGYSNDQYIYDDFCTPIIYNEWFSRQSDV